MRIKPKKNLRKLINYKKTNKQENDEVEDYRLEGLGRLALIEELARQCEQVPGDVTLAGAGRQIRPPSRRRLHLHHFHIRMVHVGIL
ncbi:hypothetical protein C1H46_027465 [Malus baccata]|uniref:Uncharacterized protein n=1 Tax=Malus baccata TaxID=106549 RepID=A0A540LKF1_MALBA|nr:hypothetical protein C1H46_027465 [Malus baccata]